MKHKAALIVERLLMGIAGGYGLTNSFSMSFRVMPQCSII